MERTGNTGWTMDAGLFLIRFMVAVVFMFHGAQKLFGVFGGGGVSGTAEAFAGMGIPMATVSAVLAGAAEFFGGLAFLTGCFQRWAAVPLTFTMLVASFTAHSGFSMQTGGMEYPLTLAFVSAGLGLTGAGAWSVDGWRTCCRSNPSDVAPGD